MLVLSEREDGEGIVNPDTGDVEADLKTVLRATAAEFADPEFEAPIRALNTEIINDPELAAIYREKMEAPVTEAKKERLRSAQRAGQLAADTDLDLVLEVLIEATFSLFRNRASAPAPRIGQARPESAITGS
ncbi:TetR-like C-terminal domain-containing protein [Saccharopolyspora spinosa]|uniref:TetR-like C-terminal domain-containing protein n=1 Tax=Saccharopolyspora spinosa TaxID=60894 RepID=UPI000237B0E7|nr:TetR-like C-terminal domain-containing protein [Saccharopolyspora spinosa]